MMQMHLVQDRKLAPAWILLCHTNPVTQCVWRSVPHARVSASWLHYFCRICVCLPPGSLVFFVCRQKCVCTHVCVEPRRCHNSVGRLLDQLTVWALRRGYTYQVYQWCALGGFVPERRIYIFSSKHSTVAWRRVAAAMADDAAGAHDDIDVSTLSEEKIKSLMAADPKFITRLIGVRACMHSWLRFAHAHARHVQHAVTHTNNCVSDAWQGACTLLQL